MLDGHFSHKLFQGETSNDERISVCIPVLSHLSTLCWLFMFSWTCCIEVHHVKECKQLLMWVEMHIWMLPVIDLRHASGSWEWLACFSVIVIVFCGTLHCQHLLPVATMASPDQSCGYELNKVKALIPQTSNPSNSIFPWHLGSLSITLPGHSLLNHLDIAALWYSLRLQITDLGSEWHFTKSLIWWVR